MFVPTTVNTTGAALIVSNSFMTDKLSYSFQVEPVMTVLSNLNATDLVLLQLQLNSQIPLCDLFLTLKV